MSGEDCIQNLLEIQLNESDDFLKIRETLTRIGISSRKDRTLYQSCHILHKRGKYYIVHFKELFTLDGLESNFTHSDLARRNRIAILLDEWGLCEIVNSDMCKDPVAPMGQIKILPHREKKNWKLQPKYHIGRYNKMEESTNGTWEYYDDEDE
tara:strand:+ start:409 stop:867 length:459 start_codon:yes stop_codon:yes gene_type:complete